MKSTMQEHSTQRNRNTNSIAQLDHFIHKSLVDIHCNFSKVCGDQFVVHQREHSFTIDMIEMATPISRHLIFVTFWELSMIGNIER